MAKRYALFLNGPANYSSRLSNLSFEVALALLGGESLAHAERHAALVQRLIGGDCDADFIPHSQQQQPALGAVDRHLSDQLVCQTRRRRRLY